MPINPMEAALEVARKIVRRRDWVRETEVEIIAAVILRAKAETHVGSRVYADAYRDAANGVYRLGEDYEDD